MEITYKLIEEVFPYEGNAKIHDDKNVNVIAESIKNFGFKIPVVIDSENIIVCGHGRIKAARLLGLEKVPCIIADDLTPEQIKAFRLADNKVGELAECDFSKLEEELSGLSGMFDMTALGFEEITYNHIEDLLHDDDAMSYSATEKDTFNITFTFPLDHKEAVTDYVGKNGKEYIANMIVDIATGVKEWE